ncbi:hypothetical protein QJQ45_005246 [Haematococcus lacustris]|nr:hypothetical protein QJQ45_005246 [Haematococcus lacustris]
MAVRLVRRIYEHLVVWRVGSRKATPFLRDGVLWIGHVLAPMHTSSSTRRRLFSFTFALLHSNALLYAADFTVSVAQHVYVVVRHRKQCSKRQRALLITRGAAAHLLRCTTVLITTSSLAALASLAKPGRDGMLVSLPLLSGTALKPGCVGTPLKLESGLSGAYKTLRLASGSREAEHATQVCPVVAPRILPQIPRSQAVAPAAASEPGLSSAKRSKSAPSSAKRSKHTKAEQAATPTQLIKAHAKAKAGSPSIRSQTDLSKWYGPDRALFLPSGLLDDKDVPSYLTGELPGDYGYDPLSLGKDPETVAKYRANELLHARWAMLAAAGIIIPEGLEANGADIRGGTWFETGAVMLNGGTLNYFAVPWGIINNPLPLVLVILIEIGLMGAVEFYRRNGSGPPGYSPGVGNFDSDIFDGLDSLYPGGPFDPLRLADDPEVFAELKVKEIKNGRLAMVSVLAFAVQSYVTGEGPYANWSKHVADPFG